MQFATGMANTRDTIPFPRTPQTPNFNQRFVPFRMLKQNLQQKLLQKSPHSKPVMKLIQLPTQAFEERLKQEIEENPALDTGKEDSDAFDNSLNDEYEDDGRDQIDTEDINIDEYLSDDEIPSYKHKPTTTSMKKISRFLMLLEQHFISH